MPAPSPSQPRALRALQRSLVRRRWQLLGGRLRVELGLLALMLGAFLFWQVRVPFDGLRRAHGPLGVLSAIGVAWLVLAALAASLTAARHARSLRAGPPGPAWLSLPLAPELLARHLAWESRAQTFVMAVPALAVLLAAVGLVPAWWLVLLAAVFALLLLEAGRLGCALGHWAAARGTESVPGRAPIEAVLMRVAEVARVPRLPAARWQRMPAWRALWSKDVLVTWRNPRLRASALVPALLAALSFAAWLLPAGPSHSGLAPLELRHATAFFLALGCAATLAEWLAGLAASDPFGALRPLPVSVGPAWWARAAWGLLATLVLSVGHLLLARELLIGARNLFLLWVGGATLAIAALGVNYGVTLFPRAENAKRLLGLSLALAVIASLMFPLAGWIVLLTAILHSTRRLSRWDVLEEA